MNQAKNSQTQRTKLKGPGSSMESGLSTADAAKPSLIRRILCDCHDLRPSSSKLNASLPTYQQHREDRHPFSTVTRYHLIHRWPITNHPPPLSSLASPDDEDSPLQIATGSGVRIHRRFALQPVFTITTHVVLLKMRFRQLQCSCHTKHPPGHCRCWWCGRKTSECLLARGCSEKDALECDIFFWKPYRAAPVLGAIPLASIATPS